jgi:hypothetical protein
MSTDPTTSHQLQPFFEPVGKLIVLFNHLDHLLLFVTMGLCQTEYGAVGALMAEASFGRKIDAFKCVSDYKVSDPIMKNRIEKFLKVLQRVEDERNRVAHTVWLRNDESMFSLKWVARRKTGSKPGLQSTTLDPILKAISSVQSALSELAAISEEFKKKGVPQFNLSSPGSASLANRPFGHFTVQKA